MSAAEPQRRRRRKLGIGIPFLPQRLLWDESTTLDRRGTELLDHLCWWFAEGEAGRWRGGSGRHRCRAVEGAWRDDGGGIS